MWTTGAADALTFLLNNGTLDVYDIKELKKASRGFRDALKHAWGSTYALDLPRLDPPTRTQTGQPHHVFALPAQLRVLSCSWSALRELAEHSLMRHSDAEDGAANPAGALEILPRGLRVLEMKGDTYSDEASWRRPVPSRRMEQEEEEQVHEQEQKQEGESDDEGEEGDENRTAVFILTHRRPRVPPSSFSYAAHVLEGYRTWYLRVDLPEGLEVLRVSGGSEVQLPSKLPDTLRVLDGGFTRVAYPWRMPTGLRELSGVFACDRLQSSTGYLRAPQRLRPSQLPAGLIVLTLRDTLLPRSCALPASLKVLACRGECGVAEHPHPLPAGLRVYKDEGVG